MKRGLASLEGVCPYQQSELGIGVFYAKLGIGEETTINNTTSLWLPH